MKKENEGLFDNLMNTPELKGFFDKIPKVTIEKRNKYDEDYDLNESMSHIEQANKAIEEMAGFLNTDKDFEKLNISEDDYLKNLEDNKNNKNTQDGNTNFNHKDFNSDNSKGNGSNPPIPKTGKEPSSDSLKIEVEYFEKNKENEKLWGFNGIAGMESLKTELKESFINPLKFKFLVEELKQKLENTKDTDGNEKKENEKGKKKTSKQKSDNLTQKEKTYLNLYKEYQKLKVGIPTGFLMYGPPGTGKTFLSKKLAEELNAGFIAKSMGELGSSYMHQTSQNIKLLFDNAKEASKKGPLILFLDEIDSLVTKRTDRVDANKAEEVSQFLQEFNKLQKDAPNLIVIAATNRPDHLDSALLRSGRFDKKIYVGVPELETRKEIFKLFINKTGRPHTKLNYEKLAALTENYVIADIENIVKEASRDAGQHILSIVNQITENPDIDLDKINKDIKTSTKISQELLVEAIKSVHSSISMVDMSIYEKWRKQINDESFVEDKKSNIKNSKKVRV